MASADAGGVAHARRDGGAGALTGRVVRAVRGATSAEHDTPEEILGSTAELLTEVLDRNGLETDDLISIIFTMTPDLTSEFPALAARQAGLTTVPLICTSEIPVPGSLGKCIRLLLHCTVPEDRHITHVYLREAKVLRPDLAREPQ